MKTISVFFKVDGYCSMLLDVPDDYQIPSTNPEIFWEDLKEKVGDQLEVDLIELDDAIANQFPLFNFNIDHLLLDHFLWVDTLGDDGKYVTTDFDYISFNV